MIKIFIPANEAELAVARSILQAEEIPHYIENEHFGSLYSGVMLKNFNSKSIFVTYEYVNEAKLLLSQFPNSIVHEEPETDQGEHIIDKLFIGLHQIFTWLFPSDNKDGNKKS